MPTLTELGTEIKSENATVDDRPLAVFDLDGTLTRRDTFLPFLTSYGRRHRRLRAYFAMPFHIGLYLGRLITDHSVKERLMMGFLAGQPMARIEEHAEWFCRNWVPSRRREAVVERLQRHQDAGDRVIVLSASPSVYVPSVARSLDVEETLCTEVETVNGICTGRILGDNCKGNRKLKRLRDHLQIQSPPAGSSSYGDSRHDLPVLRWVAHGHLVKGNRLVAVNQNINSSSSSA